METFVSSLKKEGQTRAFILLLTGLLSLAVGILVGWLVFGPGPALLASRRGYALFRKAHINVESLEFSKKVEAAGRLAKQKNSELWLVLLLLDKDIYTYTFHHLHEAEKESELEPETQLHIKTSLEKGEKGVVAEALSNIPDNADKAVLWAVTTKLLDSGKGYRSGEERIGPIPLVFAHGATEPIQDIARDTLKRCLGVDHGYDAILWRKAIIKK